MTATGERNLPAGYRRPECAQCPSYCCVDNDFYTGVGGDGDPRSVRVPRAIIPGYGLPEQDAQSNALPRVSGSEPERQLPLDYVGALPAAYDRRATPRPEVLDCREYQTKFAEELRTMRERLKVTQ